MEGCHGLVSAAGTGSEWGSGHGKGRRDARARGSEDLAPLAEPERPTPCRSCPQKLPLLPADGSA